MFSSWWTCDGKNSLELEHVAAVMHDSSPWMLEEEEELSGRSSGQQSDICGWAARSGGGGNLS
jgi:hypothetical protein